MAAIAGLRGTGDWGTDERPKSFRDGILFKRPNGQTPLQALMARMGSNRPTDPEFSWWEERLDHTRLQINGALASNTTTIVVNDGANFLVPGDLLALETASGLFSGEYVEVTARASDTSFTVTRGAAGTTAATIDDDAYLTKIGTVFAEGTGSPNGASRNPTKYFNYCQIFKEAYEITNTAVNTDLRTGDPLQNDRERKLFEIMKDMEMSMLFGKRQEGTGTNGKPKRYMGGLNSFITSHRTVFGDGTGGTTSLTEDNLIDFFSQVFNYDGLGAGDERIAFVGNAAITKLNQIVRNSNSTRINFDNEVPETYGMRFTRWTLPQGTIYFRTHPLFNTNPHMSSAMMVINPAGITEKPFRALSFQDNVADPDEDLVKGQWLVETSIEVRAEETMAVATGIK